MKNPTTEIANKLHEGVCEGTEHAINAATHSSDRGGGGPGWLYIAGMGALGALLVGAPIVGQKPPLTEEEIKERGQLEVQKLVTPERVMFCAIYAAMLLDDYNPATGELQTSFDVGKLAEVVKAWERVYPDKKAEDFLDTNIIEAVRSSEATASAAFNDVMRRVHAMSGNHSVN